MLTKRNQQLIFLVIHYQGGNIMDERERILELVREGVLSVDEALDLLESVANKETKKTEEKEFTSKRTFTEPTVDKEDTQTKADTFKEAQEETLNEEEKKQVEEELEGIANELNQLSVQIDALNEELTEKRSELGDVEEELVDSKNTLNEEYYETKKDLENRIVNLQKEIELISAIDEVDNHQEIQSLNKELTRALEDLNELENEALTDEEIKVLEERTQTLLVEIKELTDEKNKLLKEMHAIKMKQWTTKAKQVSENLDIPKEWREGATKTFDKASDVFGETSKTLGDVFRQTVNTTRDAINKIDWKDIDMNFNIPRKVQSEFEHEWLFEDTTATILDFKNANGNIQYKPSVNDNIKIGARIKFYEEIEEVSALAAFEERSIIRIDEDKFTFHVPNKNVAADMIIYLPQREYDYIRSNSFNGDVNFKDLKARDIYVKATNGTIVLNNLEATMLEIKGTNGDITLKDATLRDLLVSTVNGNVRVVGNVQSSDLNTTNGDIRLTLHGEDLIRVAGGSVNGDVKISLPEESGLEIEAKSTFGKVKSRLTNTNSSLNKEQKRKMHKIHRMGNGQICRVNVQTTTGNVLFKDTDK